MFAIEQKKKLAHEALEFIDVFRERKGDGDGRNKGIKVLFYLTMISLEFLYSCDHIKKM